MPRRRRAASRHLASRRLLRAVAAVATATLVACGGSDDERVAVVDYLEPYESQAAEYARSAEQLNRWEEAIATCMAEAGFEYVPVIWDLSDVTYLRDEYSDDEIVERFGYGITTVDPATQILDSAQIAGPDHPAVRANNDYRNSLDAASGEAYERALYGDEYVDGDWSAQPTGCSSDERFAAVNDIDLDHWEVVTGELDPLVDDLEERIEADTRVVEARAAWRECVAEAGHPYADEDEIRWAIEEQLWELQDAAPQPDWDPTSDEPEPEWGGPFDVDPDALAELRAKELEIASIDHECRGEHLGPVDEVRAELEERFIDQHRELLEERRSFLE